MSTLAPPAARADSGGGLVPSEVVVAGFQRVLVAPPNTDPPDGIEDDFEDPWVDLGYTTEDGIAFSFGLDTDTLMSSQTLDPLRMLVTARPKTIATPLRQWNRETLILAMGGGDISADGGTNTFTPPPSSFIDIRALVIEIQDGDKKARFVGYRTMVSEAVEFTAVNTDGLVFPLTFSVLANEPNAYIWQMNDEMLGAVGGGGPGPLGQR
jgi:hypothetical protein